MVKERAAVVSWLGGIRGSVECLKKKTKKKKLCKAPKNKHFFNFFIGPPLLHIHMIQKLFFAATPPKILTSPLFNNFCLKNRWIFHPDHFSSDGGQDIISHVYA